MHDTLAAEPGVAHMAGEDPSLVGGGGMAMGQLVAIDFEGCIRLPSDQVGGCAGHQTTAREPQQAGRAMGHPPHEVRDAVAAASGFGGHAGEPEGLEGRDAPRP